MIRRGPNSIKIERGEFPSLKIVLLVVGCFERLTEWRATGRERCIFVIFYVNNKRKLDTTNLWGVGEDDTTEIKKSVLPALSD